MRHVSLCLALFMLTASPVSGKGQEVRDTRGCMLRNWSLEPGATVESTVPCINGYNVGHGTIKEARGGITMYVMSVTPATGLVFVRGGITADWSQTTLSFSDMECNRSTGEARLVGVVPDSMALYLDWVAAHVIDAGYRWLDSHCPAPATSDSPRQVLIHRASVPYESGTGGAYALRCVHKGAYDVPEGTQSLRGQCSEGAIDNQAKQAYLREMQALADQESAAGRFAPAEPGPPEVRPLEGIGRTPRDILLSPGGASGSFALSTTGILTHRGNPFTPSVRIDSRATGAGGYTISPLVRSDLALAYTSSDESAPILHLLDLTGSRSYSFNGVSAAYVDPFERYMITVQYDEGSTLSGFDLVTKRPTGSRFLGSFLSGQVFPDTRWNVTANPTWGGNSLTFIADEHCMDNLAWCTPERSLVVLQTFTVRLDPANMEVMTTPAPTVYRGGTHPPARIVAEVLALWSRERASRAQAVRIATLRERYGAFETDPGESLHANPYPWQGKQLALCVVFDQMLDRTTALFEHRRIPSWERPVVVSGVPTERFRNRRYVLLVGRVLGQLQGVTHLAYIDDESIADGGICPVPAPR